MRGNINYSKKVLKHFNNPHNLGKIKGASGVGVVGNLACGDVMKLYIKVSKGVIEDTKFETYGCAAAIATSSAITDMAKGKKVADAISINESGVITELDGLPPVKIHCSLLSVDALGEAIYDYMSREGIEIPNNLILRHRRLEKLGMIEKRD